MNSLEPNSVFFVIVIKQVITILTNLCNNQNTNKYNVKSFKKICFEILRNNQTKSQEYRTYFTAKKMKSMYALYMLISPLLILIIRQWYQSKRTFFLKKEKRKKLTWDFFIPDLLFYSTKTRLYWITFFLCL